MGSCIALLLATKYPEHVKSLVLHSAFHWVPFPRNLIWGLMWKLPGGKKQMKKGAEFLFQQQYPPTLESFTRQSLAALNFDGRKLLSQVKAPTLIINGTKYQVVSMKITRELAQGIPGAKLVLIEGDHLFHIARHKFASQARS